MSPRLRLPDREHPTHHQRAGIEKGQIAVARPDAGAVVINDACLRGSHSGPGSELKTSQCFHAFACCLGDRKRIGPIAAGPIQTELMVAAPDGEAMAGLPISGSRPNWAESVSRGRHGAWLKTSVAPSGSKVWRALVSPLNEVCEALSWGEPSPSVRCRTSAERRLLGDRPASLGRVESKRLLASELRT